MLVNTKYIHHVPTQGDFFLQVMVSKHDSKFMNQNPPCVIPSYMLQRLGDKFIQSRGLTENGMCIYLVVKS